MGRQHKQGLYNQIKINILTTILKRYLQFSERRVATTPKQFSPRCSQTRRKGENCPRHLKPIYNAVTVIDLKHLKMFCPQFQTEHRMDSLYEFTEMVQ